jgi:hypothetical protein
MERAALERLLHRVATCCTAMHHIALCDAMPAGRNANLVIERATLERLVLQRRLDAHHALQQLIGVPATPPKPASDWAQSRPTQTCTGTGLTPRSAPGLSSPLPTSRPGLGSPLCHNCIGTGLTPPHLRRGWAHPTHICAGSGRRTRCTHCTPPRLPQGSVTTAASKLRSTHNGGRRNTREGHATSSG